MSLSLCQSPRDPLELSVNIIHRNEYHVLYLYVQVPVPHRFEGQLQWGLCSPCPSEFGNRQYPIDVYTCGFLSESLGQWLWNGFLPSIIDTSHSHSSAQNKLSRHIVDSFLLACCSCWNKQSGLAYVLSWWHKIPQKRNNFPPAQKCSKIYSLCSIHLQIHSRLWKNIK